MSMGGVKVFPVFVLSSVMGQDRLIDDGVIAAAYAGRW